MIARDILVRQKKFEKESKERIQKEKERLLNLEKEKERAQKLKREHEEKQRLKRIAEAEALEAEKLKEDALRELNRGIFLKRKLKVSVIPESYIKEKGIKRGNDKILLPKSMSPELMDQHAYKNGAMLFEIKAKDGKITHAGLLDFTSPEGTVGLPIKVINSLFISKEKCEGELVSISYKRLEPGTYARFQPLKYGFHELVGDDMSDLLESVMKTYCTLSINDIIDIEYKNQIHQLKVVELEPSSSVSIIDTDLSVDVTVSEEVENEIKARQEAILVEQERLKREELEKQKQLQEEENREKKRQELIKLKLNNLREEVSSDCGNSEDTIVTLVKFPNGIKIQRRFKLDDSIDLLFDYIDSQGAGGYWPGAYQIATQFPRKIYKNSKESFKDLGIISKQEIFFIEEEK